MVMPGLADRVGDGLRIFRAVLDAMAHPGRVLPVPPPLETPWPLHPAAASVCLALVDFETPLWLDPRARERPVLDYLRFHCGCRIVDEPGSARFGLVADAVAMPPLDAFDAGSDEYPDRSATLVVQVDRLGAGAGRRLAGPGIDGQAWLEVEGLPEQFWAGVRDNHARFPRGLDLLLCTKREIAALPRTTRVEG
jgi:alpha-D-ribose 1-methylphosphonate 5-triphosphate synthase subunit PhnH